MMWRTTVDDGAAVDMASSVQAESPSVRIVATANNLCEPCKIMV